MAISAAVQEGIDAAKQALDTHPECLEMFGSDKNPYQLFEDYSANGLITVGTGYPSTFDTTTGMWVNAPFTNINTAAITTHGAGSLPNPTNPGGPRISASVITINISGPYFTNLAQGRPLLLASGFTGLTLREARGAMLIHEFLHVAGTRQDQGNAERSDQISREVLEKCFANP
jgi:hypothetical protein